MDEPAKKRWQEKFGWRAEDIHLENPKPRKASPGSALVRFGLRFNRSDIRKWAARYDSATDVEVQQVARRAQARRWMEPDELRTLCSWKYGPRAVRRIASNSPEFVREVTAVSFRAADERLRIEALTLLDGVSWPTASAILHLCHVDPYPLLDFRALWSLGVEPPSQYDFPFWWEYTHFCRSLAEQTGGNMRTLDRALWQYSKMNQPPRNKS